MPMTDNRIHVALHAFQTGVDRDLLEPNCYERCSVFLDGDKLTIRIRRGHEFRDYPVEMPDDMRALVTGAAINDVEDTLAH